MKKILSLVFISISHFVYSQGCSDAGFCSMGDMMPFAKVETTKLNRIRLGSAIGESKYNVFVVTPFLEYTMFMSKKVTFNTKATMQYMHSADNKKTNLGDWFFTLDYVLQKNLSTTVGFKVPFNSGDQKVNEQPLPMDLQASLGTLDFLWAIKYQNKAWNLTFGWQLPLTQNKNQYFAPQSVIDNTSQFFTTNGFNRSPDFWGRVGYEFYLGNHFRIQPNILPIVHLGNDSYKDELGVRYEIQGSSGLTLNADAQFDWIINSNWTFGLNAGLPIVTRKVIPDGTSRKYIFTGDLRVYF